LIPPAQEAAAELKSLTVNVWLSEGIKLELKALNKLEKCKEINLTSISKLIVGGFKSIRDRTEIPIAPLTFMFGPNSAGKSAVLRSMQSFRDRIKEVSDLKEKERSYLFGSSVYRKGLIYTGLIGEFNVDEGDRVMPIHLGVGLENFNVLDACFDEDCNDSTKSFYGALDGAAVEVELIELEVRGDDVPMHFRVTESFLRIDNELLFHFIPRGFVQGRLSKYGDNVEEDGGGLSSLGVVLINLAHPLWMMTAIRDSQAHLDQIGQDPALVSDADRRKVVELLKCLQTEASQNDSGVLQHFVELNGSFLCIRAEIDFLHAEEWDSGVFGQVGSQKEVAEKMGNHFERGETGFLTIARTVNEVLMFISGLGRSILKKVDNCLSVTLIDGDRQIIRPESVTVNLPLSLSHFVMDNYWSTNWSLVDLKNGFSEYQLDHTSMYAYWLGLKQTGLEFLGDCDLQKIQCRDDFVNYIFSQGLFGFRRYEVKPEVWLITARQLKSREPVEEDEEIVNNRLQVQLYLEDQNGRRLDFHEVGSGISYVMPILVSLNAAKISWIAQPELHLHPAAQCEMGDVFLRAFNRGHFAVVETHSEHLLLRVLKRIRQTTSGVEMDDDLRCVPEAVSVLYFDPQEDGSTEIKRMRVSRLGDFIDRWPHGFFEERGQELFDE
jgi:hypothetical protein